MGEISHKCIKFAMFGFNFIFWITGIALIAAGAVAQAQYKDYSQFIQGGIVTAPALLICVGVFISVIAFLGCCGAARDHYYMLMGYAVIVGLIFVVQFAGGIAGYVERGKITSYGTNVLKDELMANYFNRSGYNTSVDNLQKELHCCGADGFADWNSLLAPQNKTGVVASCCSVKTCMPLELEKLYLDANCTTPALPSNCKIYTAGCKPKISNIVNKAITGVAGAAIGLAFFQLIGIVFSCYLAKRIRSGYVYA